MRYDLDFLYQKAMRSIDVEFIEEVCMLLIDADRYDELGILDGRLGDIKGHDKETYAYFFYSPTQSKFSFLIRDSQRGADWYRNK